MFDDIDIFQKLDTLLRSAVLNLVVPTEIESFQGYVGLSKYQQITSHLLAFIIWSNKSNKCLNSDIKVLQ